MSRGLDKTMSRSLDKINDVISNQVKPATTQLWEQTTQLWNQTTTESLLILIIFIILTFLFFTFILWIFSSPEQNDPQMVMVAPPPIRNPQPRPQCKSINRPIGPIRRIIKGRQSINRDIPESNFEVFNLKQNKYQYNEAHNVCQKYGARLATIEDLEKAYLKGANWCNLGWLRGHNAYYPTQREQVKESQKWPSSLQDACGRMGLNGGEYAPQTRLSVNCYGRKPDEKRHQDLINPFNTISQKWNTF